MLETIDLHKVPFVPLDIRREGNQAVLSFDSILNGNHVIQANATLGSGQWVDHRNVIGTGARVEATIDFEHRERYFRLWEGP
ncbi:MAG: hypothetical protein ACR2OZ_04210 [Verrucomicrobiales bacterium]